jgi:hypothetical protein
MINIGNEVVQCFELQKGQINMTSGSVPEGTHIIHAVEETNITLTWSDGSTDDVDVRAGEDVAVRGCSVTVNSGKCHIDTV